MTTIQTHARQCGKTAKMNELAMKARANGASVMSVKAWANNRVHVDRLNERGLPVLRPPCHVAFDLTAPGHDRAGYVRVFLPWR